MAAIIGDGGGSALRLRGRYRRHRPSTGAPPRTTDPALLDSAKVGVLAGSTLSAALGVWVLLDAGVEVVAEQDDAQATAELMAAK